MGVFESYAKIKRANQDMDAVWQQTKTVWKDVKSKQFEDEFIRQLTIEIKKAETALENIGPLLNRIRSELGG